MLMEIKGQETVSGCKIPFRTFHIAVMHYGVWLLIFYFIGLGCQKHLLIFDFACTLKI